MRVVIIIIALVPFLAFGQTDSFYQKAKAYYDNNQYREALYFFNKFIKADSSNALAFKWRGNCYYDINQLDSAKRDYEKALALSPSLYEVYYNLSSVYSEKKDFKTAEYSIRQFLLHNPQDVEGILKLAYTLQQTKADSSIHYFEYAYQLDPQNERTAKALGWEYFYKGDYTHALKLARNARVHTKHDVELKALEAYAAFSTGDYKAAHTLSDSIFKLTDAEQFLSLKLKSAILLRTNPDIVIREGFSFKFKEIVSDSIANLERWITTESSPYFYHTLRRKYEKENVLALDEYFMLYFGFISDTYYSPYNTVKIYEINKLWKEEKYEEVAETCEAILAKDWFNLRVMEFLAMAQRNLQGETNYHNTLQRYIGIMEGILATGKGDAFNEAMIVISASHEYDVLSYLGLNSAGQSLRRENGHYYDVLQAVNEYDVKKEYYFNIDKPFGSLHGLLDNGKADKKAKRTKRKKR